VKAVVMREFGGPEVLELKEVERPKPIPTEVLVRVTAAGINPVDWKTRERGGRREAIGDPPMILGWDVAGTVEEVGGGVTRFAPGDRVFGMPWFPRLAKANAEFVTAPSRQLALAPDALPDASAGGLPLAGLTAWQTVVDTARVKQGDRVLIHAAAGGVGHLAVQVAKARGAHVIGTARSDQHDFLRELGIDEQIDYKTEGFEEAVSEVDAVIDLVGSEDYGLRSLQVLREGGVLVQVPSGVNESVLAAAEEQSKRVTGFLVEPDHLGLESLAALAEEARLRVVVGATFPLGRAADAHEYLQSGKARGKVVLTTHPS
jgi:NADPH:quinone reductase-like Zn-dependent oxidoreductase